MKKFIGIFITILFVSTQLSFGKILHWNLGRTYHPFKYASREGILIENDTDTLKYDYFALDTPSGDFSLDFRAKNINGNPSKKYQYYNSKGQLVGIGNPHWGFFINCLKETLAITVKGGEKFTALEPVPSLNVTIHNLNTGYSQSINLTDKVNPYDGDNLWMVNISDGILNLSAGNKNINSVLSFPCNSEVKGFGFFAGWGDNLKISDINVVCEDNEEENLPSYAPDLKNYNFVKSEDSLEGFWSLFDRELEESLIKLGGTYTLACVKEGENYFFYYIDGATVNAKAWQYGDLKAVLSPTHFPGIYNVDWIDATKEHFDNDVKAQESNGNVLVIQFPYQSSKIRLRKITE